MSSKQLDRVVGAGMTPLGANTGVGAAVMGRAGWCIGSLAWL